MKRICQIKMDRVDQIYWVATLVSAQIVVIKQLINEEFLAQNSNVPNVKLLCRVKTANYCKEHYAKTQNSPQMSL